MADKVPTAATHVPPKFSYQMLKGGADGATVTYAVDGVFVAREDWLALIQAWGATREPILHVRAE